MTGTKWHPYPFTDDENIPMICKLFFVFAINTAMSASINAGPLYCHWSKYINAPVTEKKPWRTEVKRSIMCIYKNCIHNHDRTTHNTAFSLRWRHNGCNSIASQMTSLTIVYSIVYSDADQRKRESSASLTIVWGIHREPINSQHKWPVTRKMFPFDDVIM